VTREEWVKWFNGNATITTQGGEMLSDGLRECAECLQRKPSKRGKWLAVYDWVCEYCLEGDSE